ncbi:MAG: diguanylate cyclase domain-containing protein, partial [Gammaproteobacteria bacterium]
TNPSLDERLGYASCELRGVELSSLFAPEDPDELPSLQESYRRLRSGLDSRFRRRFQLRRKDGEPVWACLIVSVLRDAEQRAQHFATMVDDISDSHLLNEWVSHQALHDVQTGLPNRQYLISHLERVLGLVEPSATVTLLHLNLDGFSAINDGLGRRFGDQMLEVVAQRLRKVVAEYRAMVARIDGDEYAILIEPSEAPLDVAALAEAINTELAEPVYIQDTGVAVTATIGVVQRQGPGMEMAEMLRAASTTLHRLRGRGKRQWALFDADADAATHEDLRLAAALPGALETGELQVEHQPVVTLEDGRLVGVEAVLSWRHPQLGVLPHERCVHVAEHTGVVYALGEWLLRVAAEHAVSWQQRLGAGPPV